MEPTNQELQLQRNCRLFAYLLKQLGKEVPEDIQDCIDDYDYLVDCVQQLYEELKGLDNPTFEKILNQDNPEAQLLKQWWELQQEAEKLRQDLRQTCL